jgi:hypothetical protein
MLNPMNWLRIAERKIEAIKIVGPRPTQVKKVILAPITIHVVAKKPIFTAIIGENGPSAEAKSITPMTALIEQASLEAKPFPEGQYS